MTKDEKAYLAELINKKGKHSGDKNNLFDMAFKGLSSLTLLLVVWIFSTVNDMQQKVSNMELDNGYTKESLETIKEFTEKPRFTRDDFDQNMAPVIKQLNTNTAELNTRSAFIDETRDKLIRMEIRIESLEKDNKK